MHIFNRDSILLNADDFHGGKHEFSTAEPGRQLADRV